MKYFKSNSQILESKFHDFRRSERNSNIFYEFVISTLGQKDLAVAHALADKWPYQYQSSSHTEKDMLTLSFVCEADFGGAFLGQHISHAVSCDINVA